MPAITLEEVQKDRWDNRGALVVLQAEPRRDVLIAPQRGSTARAAVAEDVAEIADRTANMHPPLILELSVEIGVRGPIGRQPAGRPELPPVEVPECPLEQLVRLLPVERAPVVPPLLV